MEKNCLNCMRVLPIFDGTEVVRRVCGLDEGMRVNARMVCEGWRSDDLKMETLRGRRKAQK